MVEKQGDDPNVETGSGEEGGAASSSMMKILLLSLVGLFVIGGGIGATLYLTGSLEPEPTSADAAATEPEARDSGPAIYLQLDPPFTVSLDNDPQNRYLRVHLAVMARDESVIDAVRRHRPAIRNSLNFLFAVQTQQDLATKEGRERLQVEATDEIRQFLEREGEAADVQSLYFTDFVID